MSSIVFLIDFELGHLLPSLGLADRLRSAGHEIHYLGLPIMQPHVEAAGFDFTPIFGEFYPEASVDRRLRGDAELPESVRQFERHLPPMLAGELDATWRRLRPDLVVSSLFLSLETLIIHYRHATPSAIFTEYLREPSDEPASVAMQRLSALGAVGFEVVELAVASGAEIVDMSDLVEPLRRMPEWIACPQELELPGVRRGEAAEYLGPCLRPLDAEPVLAPELAAWLERDSPIVYAALGSGARRYGHAVDVYSALYELARSTFADLSFVVATGSEELLERLGPPPSNVWAESWLPQARLLGHASAMVTHGGLGSIKEAIASDVPLLVVPMDRDQPVNARRVVHHGLGRALDPARLGVERLEAELRAVLDDREIRAAVEAMGELFRRRDEQAVARLLERLEASSPRPALAGEERP